MKKSVYTSIFVLALIMIAAMPAGAFEIGARALYWFPTLDANIQADNAGIIGTNLNVKDDLGVDNESFPSVEVFGGIGKHTISLGYTPIDYSGSKTLSAPINFNGKTYAGGLNVDTDLELRMLDFQYQYRFLDVENILAGFSLTAIGQIKYIDGLASIKDLATASKAEYTIDAPIPMIGAGVHAGILAGLLEARGQFTGAVYSGNYLYEGLADLSFTPFPFIAVNAGYKMLRIKIERNDVFLDSTFSGPYIGLTVSF